MSYSVLPHYRKTRRYVNFLVDYLKENEDTGHGIAVAYAKKQGYLDYLKKINKKLTSEDITYYVNTFKRKIINKENFEKIKEMGYTLYITYPYKNSYLANYTLNPDKIGSWIKNYSINCKFNKKPDYEKLFEFVKNNPKKPNPTLAKEYLKQNKIKLSPKNIARQISRIRYIKEKISGKLKEKKKSKKKGEVKRKI